MLCSAMFVECLVLNPCCGVWYVMYGRITFSSVFAITDRRDIGLYDVPMPHTREHTTYHTQIHRKLHEMIDAKAQEEAYCF